MAICMFGCNPPGPRIDPAELASYRAQFESPEELADPKTVAEVRATLEKTEDPAATTPVVLIGQVGGVPNPFEQSQPNFPWNPGKATFYLVDQEVASKLKSHMAAQGPDHQSCAFCARAIKKSAESMAAVSFYDKTGQPIRIAANDLFDLEEDDVILVQGNASLLAGNTLVINAQKIYVKR